MMDGARNGTRSYHHGDLPAALLDAVAALIREGGLETVTLRAAARRAGVSHAAPAHHFGDKAGLLAAFAAQGFAAFTATLEAARDAAPGTPVERLRAMGRAYIAFATEHRPWFEVMFRPELVGSHQEVVTATGGDAFGVLVEQVAACLGAHATEREVLRVALATWSGVHGLATLLVDGPLEELGFADPEEATEAVLGMVLAGLRAQPSWQEHPIA
jgi:AcrR family transcriptional regulator